MSPTRNELLQAPIVEKPEDVNGYADHLVVYPEGGGVYHDVDGYEAKQIVEQLCEDPEHPPIHISDM